MDYHIDNKTYKSPSYNDRIRFLVLHYTAQNFSDSITSLTTKFSSHYLIPDPTDQTYQHQELKIFNLVAEQDRAWHAGVSSWENRNNINDHSIGIEIVNKGEGFPPYNKQQINALIDLCQDILKRYSDITPTRVIGHSDIAIGRKIDPGASFPWYELYKNHIGAWYDEATKEKYIQLYKTNGLPHASAIQSDLRSYGYNIDKTGLLDKKTSDTITAFQMHFRPQKYDGVIDIETAAILTSLTEKYCY